MNLIPDSHSTRRDWVKRFILGSAAALTAPHWAATVMAEETPGPAVLRLKLSDYPPLASPGGSIQLKFIDYLHPFTLNRVDATRFVTLDTKCTHRGCVVGPFLVPEGEPAGRMRCPCHGSRYDIEGRVFRDENGVSTEPAPNDLGRFDTSFDAAAGVVSITIPGLVLGIHSLTVQSQDAEGKLRLKLNFPVTDFAKYEVRYHATPEGPYTVIPFSTTAGGPANQTELFPETPGNVNVYVDATGPQGFFVVALKLIPY